MNEHDVAATVAVPVKVWDWPVRLFHWTLVLLLISQVVTVTLGGNAMEWHLRGGYAVLVLVLFRLLWGLFGSRHARFASFVRGPRAALRYARSLMRPPHEAHVGHNPLGGWMVVLLLAVLLGQAVTGLFSNDDIATEGPLVRWISKDLSDAITAVHGSGAWVLGVLVALHVGAVAYYWMSLRENLVHGMLTGYKRLSPRHASEGHGSTASIRALVLFAACAALVWWVVTHK